MTGRGAEGFTLHVARTQADLRRLGTEMDNCLASYGRGRTGGANRIIEVREHAQTRYAVHVRDGRIVMFEGAHNRPPDPADVPLVHDLLARAGYLAPPRPPPPAPIHRRTAPRTRTRTATRAAPARVQRRPRRPPPPEGLSVQALAGDLLRPPTVGGTEWPELAAALWATGRLPRLVDPAEATFERVVLDLAARVATGDDDALPQHPPPSPRERDAARRRLVDGDPHPCTREGWQRHRMAAVLASDLRP